MNKVKRLWSNLRAELLVHGTPLASLAPGDHTKAKYSTAGVYPMGEPPPHSVCVLTSPILVIIMHTLAASYLVPVGFRLAHSRRPSSWLAVIAARRYKLTGLWILVAAVLFSRFPRRHRSGVFLVD